MEIIKRDNKYFVQCTDGEVEISPEQAEIHNRAAAELKRYYEAWQQTYGHNKWGIADIPKDADTYLGLADFFVMTKKSFERLYHSESDTEKLIHDFTVIWSLKVSELEREIANPYGNKNLLEYQIKGYKDLIHFTSVFPKQKRDKDVEKKEPENHLQFMTDTLKPLAGNWINGSRIMTASEYKRLTSYTSYLIDTSAIPDNIHPISRTNAPNEFIKHTIYRLFKHYKYVSRDMYIDFLKKVFLQFSNTEFTTLQSTLSKHNGNYDLIVQQLLNNQNNQ